MFKYHLLAFIVVAVWGTTFVFTKLLLLNGLSPAQIFTLRFMVAYALLLCFDLLRSRSARSFRLFADSLGDELLLFGLGFFGGALYFLTENTAMNYTTTTNTSLIVSLSPLAASALISLFYKTERLSRTQMVGTLMAALGVVIVVLNGHFVLHLSPLGDSLAFSAALCWGVYSLLMIPANRKYDTIFITRKVFVYGLLSMLPYYLLRPGFPSLATILRPEVLVNLLFLGSVASMLCFLAWNLALKKIGAVTATNYVYFNPVTTILFAWLILSEQITLYFIIGTVLILFGMYLADRKRRPQNP